MRCRECAKWGDGTGTGHPYDAGPMNACNSSQVSGVQHPSFGGTLKTMVYTGGQDRQVVMTRYDYGCVLFGPRIK